MENQSANRTEGGPFNLDDGQAALIGSVVHKVTADVLLGMGYGRESRVDSRTRALHASARRLAAVEPVRRRALLQATLSHVCVYLDQLLPPAHWTLIRSEETLDRGRVDLVWNWNGRVLLDEIKTGRFSTHESTKPRQQALRYWESGRGRWGSKLVGLRGLTTHFPANSWFLSDDGFVPLSATRYLSEPGRQLARPRHSGTDPPRRGRPQPPRRSLHRSSW